MGKNVSNIYFFIYYSTQSYLLYFILRVINQFPFLCVYSFKYYIVHIIILFLFKQKEEKKENVEKKEAEKAIILKALVHCEGCSDKICKCLKGLAGNFFHCISLLIIHVFVFVFLFVCN